jgi:hypothetical protein
MTQSIPPSDPRWKGAGHRVRKQELDPEEHRTWNYQNVALHPEVYFKVRVWADARGCTLAEAVDYAMDNLGIPKESE